MVKSKTATTKTALLLIAFMLSSVVQSQDAHSSASSRIINNNAPASSLRRNNRLLQVGDEDDTTNETTTPTGDDGANNTADDGGKKFFAYLCDENQEEIETDRPIKQGESQIHFCIQRGRSAILQNLYIYRMNIFEFYKTDDSDSDNTDSVVKQRVINNGVVTTNNESRMVGDCNPGSTICSFITKLKPQFFETDGTVTGIGTVAIQEGDDSSGGNFRGVENIQFEFDIEGRYSKNTIQSQRFKVKDHWNDLESHEQGLYMAGIIVLILICFCFCIACILWKRCCADVVTYRRREEEEEDEEAKNKNQQTIYYVTDPIYYNKKKKNKKQQKQNDIDDLSETHSLDDDDDFLCLAIEEEETKQTTTPPKKKKKKMKKKKDVNKKNIPSATSEIVPYFERK